MKYCANTKKTLQSIHLLTAGDKTKHNQQNNKSSNFTCQGSESVGCEVSVELIKLVSVEF